MYYYLLYVEDTIEKTNKKNLSISRALLNL